MPSSSVRAGEAAAREDQGDRDAERQADQRRDDGDAQAEPDGDELGRREIA